MLKSLKSLGIILPAFVLFSCASAPVSESPAAAGSPEKAPEWVTVTVDEYFVSQETVQYDDGFVDGYRLFEYDDNGRVVKESQIASDESVISEEFFYYEEGVLVRSEFFSGNDLISQSVFSYDGRGLLAEESFMNAAGDLQGLSSYEYDGDGRRTKWISGDNGGIPLMYTEYEYKGDSVGRIAYHLPSGELEGYTQMSYDGALLTEEATYSASSKLEKKTEYLYEGDRLAKASFFLGRKLSRTVEYGYDDKGNVIEEKTLNRNGDVTDIILKEYIMIPVTKQVLK